MQWRTPRFSLLTLVLTIVIVSMLGVSFFPTVSFLHRCEQREDSLLNPLIQCQRGEVQTFVGEYEDFESELSAWIDRQVEAGVVDSVAVYFRDLSAGPWFGINERTEFIPSSLFKLPLMIAVLRASQSVDNLLHEQVSLSGAYTGLQNITDPNQTVVPGRDYEVIDLLEKMMVYSDNAAQYVLQQMLHSIDHEDKALKRVYQELGILNFYEKQTLTVKAYASLFRVLYNSRYLPPELSEIALDLLSRSAFQDGLEKGVPPGIVVAHKFGVRDLPDEPTKKQLHDCGIIYHPKRPYLLCIMTLGQDKYRNADLIGDISRRVFDAVTERVGGEQ
jgi:beta-lactamase class A